MAKLISTSLACLTYILQALVRIPPCGPGNWGEICRDTAQSSHETSAIRHVVTCVSVLPLTLMYVV